MAKTIKSCSDDERFKLHDYQQSNEEEGTFVRETRKRAAKSSSQTRSSKITGFFQPKRVKRVEKSEESIQKLRDRLERIFLVATSDEVFDLWQFCCEQKPSSPCDAFEDIALKLVGPFDVLSGAIDATVEAKFQNDDSLLRHWRFFYDVPEMQTFAVRTASEDDSFHLAYFRDSPQDDRPLVVSNTNESPHIIGVADNVFSALHAEIAASLKSQRTNKTIKELKKSFEQFCASTSIDFKAQSRLSRRQASINAPTLNRFGISVPCKNDVRYRELPFSDKNLATFIEQLVKHCHTDEQRKKSGALRSIQRAIHLTNYANDEMDFGMGLELGLDLFAAGHEFFHRSSQHLLQTAYNLLDRSAYGRIVQAHLKHRSKNHELSVLIKSL